MRLRKSQYARVILFSLTIAMVIPPWVFANGARIIELSDGSRISGDIVDYENGTYSIRSETLGVIRLQDEQIQSIHAPGTGTERVEGLAPAMPDQVTVGQLQGMQNRIMSNPEMLSLVMSLQQDPALLTIVNDPQVMRAILSGQIGTLQDNPKIHQLERNPTIQKIMRMLNQ